MFHKSLTANLFTTHLNQSRHSRIQIHLIPQFQFPHLLQSQTQGLQHSHYLANCSSTYTSRVAI